MDRSPRFRSGVTLGLDQLDLWREVSITFVESTAERIERRAAALSWA